MTIVFDNNIVLDALLERKPFYADAAQLLTACAGEHTGCLVANSLTDIFYVLSKFVGATKAKQSVKKLTELLHIISVSEADCINALELPMDDFEDALLASCAKKAGAEYIISRDIDFARAASPVQVMSPSEFLSGIAAHQRF